MSLSHTMNNALVGTEKNLEGCVCGVRGLQGGAGV